MATLTLPQSLQGKLPPGMLRTGLVLGYQIEQKYCALSLAITPAIKYAPVTTLEDLLRVPLTDDEEMKYTDWIVEHARQAQRLLPAGLSVLGVFASSGDESLHDFKSSPPLLRSLLSLAEDVNREVLRRDSVLVLHFLSERQKWAGRAVDNKGGRVNVVEVKAGTAPKLEEVKGIYKLDAHFSDAETTVREGVEKILTNVASKLQIDRILVSRKADGPLPPLKADADHHSLEILSSSISSYLSHTRPPQAQIGVSGAIETRAYIPSKTSVPLVAEVVRSDIVQSLKYRLSLYYESAGENSFSKRPAESKSGVYSLPYRVFYRTEASVSVCDYVAEGETVEVSRQRVSDLTGFASLSEGETAEQLQQTIRVDTEPQSEPRSAGLRAAPLHTAAKSPPYWLYAVVAVFIALVLRLLLS